jgi:ADP-heptose:LPS heptosyltransferase
VWRHLAATIGGSGDCTPIACPPALRAEAREALRAAGWDDRQRLVVVHAGAGGVAKRWPPGGFVDVVRAVDRALVIHQGPADGDAVKELLARLDRPVLPMTEPPLPRLAGALSLACAYIGNDSGISHLAAAMGTSSVVLFTPAALPWVPWSRTARCLTVTTSAVVDAEREAVTAALDAVL